MYEIFGITDVGCVREHNEDGFLIQNVHRNQGELYVLDVEESWIAAVADGMGGQEAGEVASYLALQNIAKLNVPVTEEEIRKQIVDINDEIRSYGENYLMTKGLGTTLTGLICNNHEMTLFHIGDSRVYRFRAGFLKQKSQDHSLVEEMFQNGNIAREEKRTHPDRHILLRSLGSGNPRGEASVKQIKSLLDLEDTYLICSDGLSDCLSEDDIEGVLNKNSSLETAAHTLVERAKEAGGEDNITVVLIRKGS